MSLAPGVNLRKFVSIIALLGAFVTSASNEFVRVNKGKFELAGKPYYFVGTNFWYGMNLGSKGDGGNRGRLKRELDRLQDLGIKNLRILAMTEGPGLEPWRIIPAVQNSQGLFDETLLNGLDTLLVEMKKRKMTAVVCLNNFWPWSGGMAQYLQWNGAGPIPYPPPHPKGDWGDYQKYTAKFYSNTGAMNAFKDVINLIVNRKNNISEEYYKNDPTIMAWELANEPRGVGNTSAFQSWIDETAKYIKSLDANHMVTTGSEGETPWPYFSGVDFSKNHSSNDIDYTTAHIWVENWGYYDPRDADKSFAKAVDYMKKYLKDHLEKSKKMGKPLVLEEFGFSRDNLNYSPDSAVSYRDKYYKEVFNAVYEYAKAGEPMAGVNFWAWSGEGYPVQPYGGFWREGLPFLGDPPHENQGWYSVYESDKSTHNIIGDYASRMTGLKRLRRLREP